MNMFFLRIFLLLFAATSAINCSSVNSRYVKKDYCADRSLMFKNVVLTAQAPREYRDLDRLLLTIAADTFELKLNYLVHQKKTVLKQSELNCGKQAGIILLSIEKIQISNEDILMAIKCELFDCRTGELLWHISSEKSFNSDNRDLENLTAAYKNDFGGNAEIFSAVIFTIIRDIAEKIPDPILTEDEKTKKIELEVQLPLTDLYTYHYMLSNCP